MGKRKNKQKVFEPGSIVYFGLEPILRCSCVAKIISITKTTDRYKVDCLLYDRGIGIFAFGCKTIGICCSCSQNAWKVSPSCYELLKLFMKDTDDEEI